MTAKVEWEWQDGTSEFDEFFSGASGANNAVILAGYTYGDWDGKNAGSVDFAVVKLDAYGKEEWRWQGGTNKTDTLYAAASYENGDVVVAGNTCGSWHGVEGDSGCDFAAMKVDTNGNELWRWQGGSASEFCRTAASAQDGSVVLAGSTSGDWNATNAGRTDFAAVKLDSDGEVLWRWQGGTNSSDDLYSVAVDENNSVVLVGLTGGAWEGANEGSADFAMVKLDANGSEMWRWQEGTRHEESGPFVAIVEDNTISVGGASEGCWTERACGGVVVMGIASNGTNLWRWQDHNISEEWHCTQAIPFEEGLALAGYIAHNNSMLQSNFIVLQLVENVEKWRWEDGSDGADQLHVAVRNDESSITVAGGTTGNWSSVNQGKRDFAAVRIVPNREQGEGRDTESGLLFGYSTTEVAFLAGGGMLAVAALLTTLIFCRRRKSRKAAGSKVVDKSADSAEKADWDERTSNTEMGAASGRREEYWSGEESLPEHYSGQDNDFRYASSCNESGRCSESCSENFCSCSDCVSDSDSDSDTSISVAGDGTRYRPNRRSTLSGNDLPSPGSYVSTL